MRGKWKKKPVRIERDYYPTPEWCVAEFLRVPRVKWALRDGFFRLCDPCAGDGAIYRAANNRSAVGYEPFCSAELSDIEPRSTGNVEIRRGDFLSGPISDRISTNPRCMDICLTNPPYSLSLEFVERAVQTYPLTCMLLPLSFLASKSRNDFIRLYNPAVYVIPRRPSFVNRKTDHAEYGWFCWAHKSAREPWPWVIADERVHVMPWPETGNAELFD